YISKEIIMLEKTTRINNLYDYYVSLLTEKQKNYLSLYYHEDYPLGEISEQTNVSGQAVYDNIKRTENLLEHYEANLKLYEKNTKRNNLIEEVAELIENEKAKRQIFKKLDEIANIDYEGFSMACEGLSDRLQETMKKITGKGKVSEQDVNTMSREIRLALLEADVNFKVVKDFIKKIKERAVGADVMESLTPGQQVIKIVQEELTELMG